MDNKIEVPNHDDFTNYLKTLDDNQLLILNIDTIVKDLDEDIYNDTISSIKQEISFRKLSGVLNIKDSEFISKFYELPITELDNDEDFEILFSDENRKKLVKWCPILLYIKRTYRIYCYLKSKGYDNQKIMDFLCSNFKKCILLSNSLENFYNFNDKNNEEFLDFVSDLLDKLSKGKQGTESYDLYIKDMFNKNKSLLKRLS